MLKEKISYREELPINCYAVHIEDYPIHFHDDLEVAFVLWGQVMLKNGYYTYKMEAGDVFILNDREIHSFYSTGEPNAVMILQLDLSYFQKYYDGLRNSFFVTDMEDGEDSSLDALRSILSKIMLETLAAEPGFERRAVEYTHDLIDCLTSDFQYFALEDGRFVNEAKNRGNKVLAGRMRRITNYLYENYNRRLTLSEIAEREHLSIFYLSHVIKEASGLCFQELLNFIRVEESEKLLLGTNKKIGAISLESGFSAVRYYIKYFSKWFGMHPAEYRKKYYGHVRSRETSFLMRAVPKDEAEKMVRVHAKEVYEDRNRGSVLSVELDLEQLEFEGGRGRKTGLPETETDREAGRPETGAGPEAHLLETGAPGSRILELLDMRCLSPVTGLIGEFLRLEGELAYADDHCLVKVDGKASRSLPPDRISILFYHYDEQIPYETCRESTLEEMRELAARYDGKAEILLKLSGLSGEYSAARCHLDRETILAKYDAMVHRAVGETLGERDRLLHRWRSLHSISFEQFRATGSFNIQSFLSGFSGELILLDRIA